LLHLRWKSVPSELGTILRDKLQNDRAKIESLSIGLESRFYIRYSEDGVKFETGMLSVDRKGIRVIANLTIAHGPNADDWWKLKLWLDNHQDPTVVLGPRRSWLAYGYEGEFCCFRSRNRYANK
jgi:hypothetical protein